MSEQREYDEAVEALRRAINALPRFSFMLDDKGNVRRVQDRSGSWIEWQAAHELFDPVVVDGLLATSATAAALRAAAAPGAVCAPALPEALGSDSPKGVGSGGAAMQGGA
jgi:hypothetical protein